MVLSGGAPDGDSVTNSARVECAGETSCLQAPESRRSEKSKAGFQTSSGPRLARLDIRSIVQDMNERAGREISRHQDATPTPTWLSRELQRRAYEAQVAAGRVPNDIVNEDRNIPTLTFNGERDSYLQLLTSRWCNPETPIQLIDFMLVQHESLEKKAEEDVPALRRDVNPRAKAGEDEAGTLDLDMRLGTTLIQAGHNHGDRFSTVSRRAEHDSNPVPPTHLVVLDLMKLQHERLGNDERGESDSQQDVHPRVNTGENKDSLDLTLRLGRTCETGHEHGGNISANRTGTIPWTQLQCVHSSLTSTPPRPRRTLNLLKKFAR